VPLRNPSLGNNLWCLDDLVVKTPLKIVIRGCHDAGRSAIHDARTVRRRRACRDPDALVKTKPRAVTRSLSRSTRAATRELVILKFESLVAPQAGRTWALGGKSADLGANASLESRARAWDSTARSNPGAPMFSVEADPAGKVSPEGRKGNSSSEHDQRFPPSTAASEIRRRER
jgi:hypothetical protein